jgi:hypothetical protein
MGQIKKKSISVGAICVYMETDKLAIARFSGVFLRLSRWPLKVDLQCLISYPSSFMIFNHILVSN